MDRNEMKNWSSSKNCNWWDSKPKSLSKTVTLKPPTTFTSKIWKVSSSTCFHSGETGWSWVSRHINRPRKLHGQNLQLLYSRMLSGTSARRLVCSSARSSTSARNWPMMKRLSRRWLMRLNPFLTRISYFGFLSSWNSQNPTNESPRSLQRSSQNSTSFSLKSFSTPSSHCSEASTSKFSNKHT